MSADDLMRRISGRGQWSAPNSLHAPGSTVSLCPLCGWEYEHPPVIAEGWTTELFVEVDPAALLREHSLRVEAALRGHVHDVHGAATPEQFIWAMRGERSSGDQPVSTDDLQAFAAPLLRICTCGHLAFWHDHPTGPDDPFGRCVGRNYASPDDESEPTPCACVGFEAVGVRLTQAAFDLQEPARYLSPILVPWTNKFPRYRHLSWWRRLVRPQLWRWRHPKPRYKRV